MPEERNGNNLPVMSNFCHNPPLMDHNGFGIHFMNLEPINGELETLPNCEIDPTLLSGWRSFPSKKMLDDYPFLSPVFCLVLSVYCLPSDLPTPAEAGASRRREL